VTEDAVIAAISEIYGPEIPVNVYDLGLIYAIDLLDDGVSAVYSFYDPQQPRRSLGTWSILWLVEQCRRNGQPFVYLGDWSPDSPKMAYKARFPALEHLADGSWTEFTSDAADPPPFPEE